MIEYNKVKNVFYFSQYKNIMDLSFLKNPILLAIIAGIITYIYMYYENEKKYKKNPKIEKQQTGFIIPGVVAVLVWFIASRIFAKRNEINLNLEVQNLGDTKMSMLNNNQNGGSYAHDANLINKNSLKKLIHSENLTNSFDSKTYHLVGKNAIKLPQTDVFIDIAKF